MSIQRQLRESRRQEVGDMLLRRPAVCAEDFSYPGRRVELLDRESLSADSPAHRTTRGAPHVITSPTESTRRRVSGDPARVSLNGTVEVTNPGNGGAHNLQRVARKTAVDVLG